MLANRLFWLGLGSATLITVLFCWVSWTFFIEPMDAAVRTVNALESAFENGFPSTPRISANAGVLVGQRNRGDRFVLFQTRVPVQAVLSGERPGGGDLTVRSEVGVEAGILCREPFQVNVARGGQIATVVHPKVRFLAPATPPEIHPEGVPWGALPERLQRKIERVVARAAEQKATQDGALKEGMRRLHEQLGGLAAPSGCVLVFEPAPAR
jgi:hypothetical protein